MFAARRFAASSRRLAAQQPPRRFGSHSAHAEPVNEGIGRSFYVTVGSIASAYILYRISQSTQDSGSESWISGLISKFTPSEKDFEQRNAIHTALMEKAAADRHLLHSQGPRESYDLRTPEMLNSRFPYNVAPGSQADLSKVKAYYERQNAEIEAAGATREKLYE
ncbi:uncharacterized protein N7443_000745 [Penicillium atrosanguineum]|uniref:NADH-ubiquinone oxidoreductase 17.8 kDa subunit n=1 Tax=Penicillium atrosanguineum TaxID=1132637 RepID=A0A9W9QCB4_9EURO|nr:uncharacterized protein N7443_000745 [Penicillium atrosanguineum]KAJ5147666.1 hypothetical protein N7526_001018 [Penicillium atrosanguineum]KAJ5313861.1 hypothetical protein N7443_000745 [Penicillium atrosanguineum]KAJ5331032.1 hypothetical protein N7476_000815 [Penicillium atrosanguineum]